MLVTVSYKLDSKLLTLDYYVVNRIPTCWARKLNRRKRVAKEDEKKIELEGILIGSVSQITARTSITPPDYSGTYHDMLKVRGVVERSYSSVSLPQLSSTVLID